MNFKLSWTLFVAVSTQFKGVLCEVKFCGTDFREGQFSADATYCPHGLLVTDGPAIFYTSDQLRLNGKLCYIEDACRDSKLHCDHIPPGRFFKAHYLSGNVTVKENMEVFGSQEPCDLESTNDVLKRKKRQATTPGESHLVGNRVATPELIEETRQMFLYLAGLDPIDVSADLESSKLLQDVLSVMEKRCDPTRLDPLFLKSVYKAFLWLLNRYRSSELEDTPTETARKVKKALSKCAYNPHAIHVSGTECLSKITYVSLQVGENGIEAAADYHLDDKFSFRWGMYDPVVDAVWLSIDAVHTLCSKYLESAGVLHQFSTYMIKLLNLKRMKERWMTPTPLRRQEIYDHMLLAPVNQSMAILDACNFAGTIASPFGRSIRPHLKPLGISPIRKRRSPTNPSVMCLQSELQFAALCHR